MLLGDVGGLSGFLFAVGAFIVGLITYQSSENELVNKLFVANKLEPSSASVQKR